MMRVRKPPLQSAELRRQSRNSAVGADRGRCGGFLACAVAPGDDACVWKTKLISVDTTTKRADASPPPSCGPTKKQQMESNQRATHFDPPGARAWRPDVGCQAMAASPRARSMRATPQGMAEARFRGRKAPRALARNPFFSGALPFLRVRRAAPPGGGASGLGGVMEPAGARVVAAALAGDGVGQTAQRAQTAGGRRALCRCAVPSKAPRGGEPRANSAPLRCVAGASATPLPNAMSFDSKRRRWRERRGLHTSCVPVPSCGARMCSALSRRAQGPYLRHRDFGRDPSTWYASLRPRLARARGSAALSAARLRVV